MTITDFDAKLADAQAAYRQLFSDLFLSEKPGTSVYADFTHEDTCDGTSYEYDFLSNDPVMREWVGNKNLVPLRANSLRIEVKSYEKSTSIPLVQIRGDKSGIIGQRLARWLSAVKRDKDKLAFDVLIAGFSDLGFDGVALFSASHPNGPSGGLQSNTGTSALTVNTFKAALTVMQSLRDENGESLGISPDVLMVGPALKDLANIIVNAQLRPYPIVAAGTEGYASALAVTNVNNSLAPGMRVVVNPRLVGTYDDYWFLVDSTKDGKPVIMASQGEPEAKDNLLDYKSLPNAEFSVEWHAAIGLGHWATAYGSAV